MGGAVSLFDQNDWTIADGGLGSGTDAKDDDDDQHQRHDGVTIDGRRPTTSYETYHLLKKAVLANQREFDVTDSKSNLIYTVRPSVGTIAEFDVLGVNGSPNNQDDADFLLHVGVDLARRYWTVYRVNRPCYPGQRHDEEATAKLAADLVKKDIATLLSESLAVTSFVEPIASSNKPTAATNDEGSNATTRTTPAGASAGVVETQNDIVVPPPPPVKYLLYKSCCVTVSWSRYMAVAAYYGPPSADQILSYNAKSALSSSPDERMTSALSLSPQSGGISGGDNDLENIVPVESRDETKDQSGVMMVEGEDEKKTDTPEECDEPSTEPSRIDNSDDTAHSDAAKNESSSVIPLGTTQMSPRTLADDLASSTDSDAASTDDANDDDVEEISNGIISKVRSHHELENDIPDNAVPTLTKSSSMPDLAPTKQLSFRSWINQKSLELQKSIAQTNISTTNNNNNNTATKPAEQQDGSSKTQQQQMLQSLFPIAMKAVKLPNPDEGVVHLDKPLLLCQEIYNKIIGNHQTSRVTKERVMKLLRQDMEQHERNEHKAGDDESSSIEVVDGRGPMVCAVSESPGSGVEESKEDVHAQETAPQPLVGYWNWENTIRTHKMKMHLAKGSDLALHVVLAVLVNQVRYERNAIAMTV